MLPASSDRLLTAASPSFRCGALAARMSLVR
jgi:hypothetical protein